MNQKAINKISYGMYAIGTKLDDKTNFQIANTVFQVTSNPVQIAVSINKKNYTRKLIEETKKFSISVLSKKSSLELIQELGLQTGRGHDKLKNVKWKLTMHDLPVLDQDVVAFVELELIGSYDAGTHTLFIGKMINAEIVNDCEVLTYEEYRKIKKGLTPASAPTFNV